MISVIILTKNEAADLPACLDSLRWCDDVHVFDSFSEDDSISIARSAGATVTQREFDNYARQRNEALAIPSLRHRWVLFLDADERTPERFAREIVALVRSAPADVAAFRGRRRDYFMGRWLKHAQISPFFVRLLRRGAAQFDREVNEVVQVHGRIGEIGAHFDHFPFSKGVAHWIQKHNAYSTMEARLLSAALRNEKSYSLEAAFFSSDFNERRRHQKELFYRLPARPLVKLCYMLFCRGALLDGLPGIRYSVLQSVYEWLITLKAEELLNHSPAAQGGVANSIRPTLKPQALLS